MLRRVFGLKKKKKKDKKEEEEDPLPSIHDISSPIKATKMVERVEERIRTLNAELIRYREQMKRTPPGTARESIKARATHLLQQKRTYERQLDFLCNQTSNVDQAAFAALETLRTPQKISHFPCDLPRRGK